MSASHVLAFVPFLISTVGFSELMFKATSVSMHEVPQIKHVTGIIAEVTLVQR